MTALHRLSAVFIKSAPMGKHSDGSGLWFHKRPDGGSQWILRVVVNGRRREMGLGGYPAVGLKEARELAALWRQQAKLWNDPIKTRDNERREAAQRKPDVVLRSKQAGGSLLELSRRCDTVGGSVRL